MAARLFKTARGIRKTVALQPGEEPCMSFQLQAQETSLHEEAARMEAQVMATQAANRHEAIARIAYRLAARRGFAPDHEVDDWLAAERQQEAWERGCGRDPHWP